MCDIFLCLMKFFAFSPVGGGVQSVNGRPQLGRLEGRYGRQRRQVTGDYGLFGMKVGRWGCWYGEDGEREMWFW